MGGWAVLDLPQSYPTHRSIEPPCEPARQIARLIELRPFGRLDQFEVLHELKDVRELSKGSNCYVEKAAKLPWTFLCRSFGDVRRHRKSSSSGLGCETVTFFAREALGYTIRGEDQLVSGLPSL